jgi:hypothetical protein
MLGERLRLRAVVVPFSLSLLPPPRVADAGVVLTLPLRRVSAEDGVSPRR